MQTSPEEASSLYRGERRVTSDLMNAYTTSRDNSVDIQPHRVIGTGRDVSYKESNSNDRT